jgi:4,5-dihydroxyphthalate decarboxylase
MTKLKLSVAVGDYDRTRPLMTGAVQIDGVDPVYMALSPEEIFFRAFRANEFDICELSLSSSTVRQAEGELPYVGVPVFLSRAFRHTCIYVRKDRIKHPSDLKGKRVGLPEYQLTAMVWARALLDEEYGVSPSSVTWVRGGISEAGRPEKIKLDLPADVKLENAPDGETISSLLMKGEIDAFMAPRAPALPHPMPEIGWLFDDPVAEAKAFYHKRLIFPIMHIVGIRKNLVEQHPWLPNAVYKAFNESKDKAIAHLDETSATKVTLPFIEERIAEARGLMGHDYWSYGLGPNRHVLEYFFRHHHAQGLSKRLVGVEELFDPSTFETFKL